MYQWTSASGGLQLLQWTDSPVVSVYEQLIPSMPRKNENKKCMPYISAKCNNSFI